MQTSAVEHSEIPDSLEIDERWRVPHWFALYTRSRHEKFVERELQKKGIETFLPLRRVARHWSDREKIIEDPLFSGYLFIHTTLRERFNVLNTKGVVRFLGSRGLPSFLSESVLTAVRRFVDAEINVDPFPYLKAGMRVYVKSGPFRGVEGFVVRKDGQCRLVVSVDLLMQSVSVQIDQACIEPV